MGTGVLFVLGGAGGLARLDYCRWAGAGATLPLVDPSYTPDAAAAGLTDGLTDTNSHISYLDAFPYLGTPLAGFDHPSS
jgi:hypothetical protein